MTDFVNHPLSIGDIVVYSHISGHSHIMTVEKIIGFTEKMLKVKENVFYEWDKGYKLISPKNCVWVKA